MDKKEKWQQFQQEFLSACVRGFSGSGVAGDYLSDLRALFTPATDKSTHDDGSRAAPWVAFKQFAELLRLQSELMKANRKRRIDVGAAVQAMVKSMTLAIDSIVAVGLASSKKAEDGTPYAPAEFATWPSLGLAREWQTGLQRCWIALAMERETAAPLQILRWRALRSGCEQFQRSLQLPGAPITSLRQLYDAFVDALELAHRETAMSDEYSRAFGAHVNAILSARMAVQALVSRITGLFELAGAAEIGAIERRLRALEDDRVSLAHASSAKLVDESAPGTPVSTPAIRARPEILKASPRAAPRQSRVKGVSRSEFDIGSVIVRGKGGD